MKSEAASSLFAVAAKASPPVAVIAGAAAGIDWQKWVWIATFAYVVLQIGVLAWDRIVRPLLKLRK